MATVMDPMPDNMDGRMAEAGECWRMFKASQAEAGATFIELGKRLQQAKGRVPHGAWLPALKEIGVPVQVAQRAMRLANAGVKCVTVTHLGIRRCVELLASGHDGDRMTGE